MGTTRQGDTTADRAAPTTRDLGNEVPTYLADVDLVIATIDSRTVFSGDTLSEQSTERARDVLRGMTDIAKPSA